MKAIVTEYPARFKIELKDGRGKVVQTEWARTKYRADAIAEEMAGSTSAGTDAK